MEGVRFKVTPAVAATEFGPGGIVDKTPMSISRHFIDWSRPALPAAADWLVDRGANGSQLDLGGTIVVVPGARAGRRLLDLLVQRADEQSLVLLPPTITTEHALPELLYQPKRPFA